LFCVLFLRIYTVTSFLFVDKFKYHCHRVGENLNEFKNTKSYSDYVSVFLSWLPEMQNECTMLLLKPAI